MNRVLLLTLMAVALIWALPASGQDYNPSSPDEPGVPPARLVLLADPANGGTVSDGGLVTPGKWVNITATRATGFTFVNWTDADGQVVSTTQSYLFCKSDTTETYTAHFVYDPTAPNEPSPGSSEVYYQLTLLASEGGTVSGGGRFKPNTTVTFSASPSTDYAFVGWRNDAGEIWSTERRLIYTTTEANVTFTAVFTYAPGAPAEPGDPVLMRNIMVTATEGGTAYTSATRALQGTQVTLSAYPNSGYVFDGWYVDEALFSTNKSYKYVVGVDNMCFEARFLFSPGSPNEPASASGDLSFYLMSSTTNPGRLVECPLYITNGKAVGDMRFNLQFPSVAVPDWSTLTLHEAAAVYQPTVTPTDEPGEYLITLTGATLPPGNLPLLIVSANIDQDAPAGTYPVKINQVSVIVNDESVTGTTRNGRIYVYTLGDANGDGSVTVSDIVTIVSAILGSEPANLIFDNADVNGDGTLTVSDIVNIVNIILTQS